VTQLQKVSLKEIMEDDDSPYMQELIDRFMSQYGSDLERIVGPEKWAEWDAEDGPVLPK
jgi:hypothetical protein